MPRTPILRSFTAPFDHHAPRGGRKLFDKFAADFASRFDTPPQIINEPVFTYAYKRTGKPQLDRLALLCEAPAAVVYLSNIVMHSSLLIIGDCDTSGLQSPLEYESLDAFLAAPYVRGYRLDRDKPLQASFDDTTVVISDLARFRDDDDELPHGPIFRVLARIHDVFVCNILDYPGYFAHCAVHGDQPFFLPPGSGVDFEECVKRLDEDVLREYLLDQSVPFATLGDDHMDDEFAVSYGINCWQCTDEQLAFAR